MDDFSRLTPEQLALLQSVSDPDLPIAGLPSIYTVQNNSRVLLDLPELGAANPYLRGAIAGGFVVPNREGRVFMPSSPGFTFAVFAFTKEFAIFEIEADTRACASSNRIPKCRKTRSGRMVRRANKSVATAKAVSSRSRATPS